MIRSYTRDYNTKWQPQPNKIIPLERKKQIIFFQCKLKKKFWGPPAGVSISHDPAKISAHIWSSYLWFSTQQVHCSPANTVAHATLERGEWKIVIIIPIPIQLIDNKGSQADSGSWSLTVGRVLVCQQKPTSDGWMDGSIHSSIHSFNTHWIIWNGIEMRFVMLVSACIWRVGRQIISWPTGFPYQQEVPFESHRRAKSTRLRVAHNPTKGASPYVTLASQMQSINSMRDRGRDSLCFVTQARWQGSINQFEKQCYVIAVAFDNSSLLWQIHLASSHKWESAHWTRLVEITRSCHWAI